jgi:8-oxo-dGTP diphosphatase
MKTIIVLGAIIEKDGKILLARRKAGRGMAGKWEFPGGKLEPGETEQECLKREIMEEMKTVIETGEFFAETVYGMGKREINLKCYKAKLLTEKMKLTDHDAIVWVTPDEVMDYDLSPADAAIAKKLKFGRSRGNA